jgi:hypothetical protein
MEEVPPEAIVTSVMELPRFEGVAPIFRVEAEMYVPARKYSDGLFRVKVLNLETLQGEQGSWLEHGKFSFDTLKQVKERERFKISVSPATSTP